MTFLQPFVLWGLPLVLVPVVIHLINRMRHRPQPWAAMRFLLSATRSSVSQQKLRQLLILLFRVLAVLALVLFLSRPLAGGWLGWVVAPAPDVILMLLDRSASMETQWSAAATTAREHALKLLAQAAQEFEEASHLVLIENVFRTAQEIARAESLPELSWTAPTDTAADLPALFQSALNWLVENRAGTAEIWVASDLQRSNWQPEDPRWKSVVEQLTALPQKVRVRLLSLRGEEANNASVSLQELLRQPRGGQAELHFTVDVQRNAASSESFPLGLTLDGARSQTEIAMESQVLRWRHRAELGAKRTGGWGSLELPADANRRDNTAYFVYGPELAMRAIVVAGDPLNGRYFQIAASSLANNAREPAPLVPPSEFHTASLESATLLVWQEALPSGPSADRIRAFVEEGGVAVFFPPARLDPQRFLGFGWGEMASAQNETPFRIVRWAEDQGPLAKTDEGFSLPVAQLGVRRRQEITGHKSALGTFQDGTAFLSRQTLGRGEFYFCASLPGPEWSSLDEGFVLVPMLQRLMQTGSKRLQPNSFLSCGELTAADQAQRWAAVDAVGTAKDIRSHAGVYRSGERLVAANRPAKEDEPERVDPEQLRNLFGELPYQLFQDTRNQKDQFQGEFWRVFLFGMLLFLLVEAVLILPPRAAGLPGQIVRTSLVSAPTDVVTS